MGGGSIGVDWHLGLDGRDQAYAPAANLALHLSAGELKDRRADGWK